MTKYVLIRDMASGNESVGEMWQETKIFDGSATIEEVMSWAIETNRFHPYSRKKVTITKPHE